MGLEPEQGPDSVLEYGFGSEYGDKVGVGTGVEMGESREEKTARTRRSMRARRRRGNIILGLD